MGKKGKKNSTMSIRSKDDIRQSMVAKGIISVDGKVNEKAMVENAQKSVAKSAEVLKKTSKSKTVKAKRTSTKNVVVLEGVNNYEQKAKLFDNGMTVEYGERYNAERGTVKFDRKGEKPFYVNVLVQEMKVRSDRTKNTSGLRVYMCKNGSSYSIGEYAGKISIDRIAKRIQIIADTEMSK